MRRILASGLHRHVHVLHGGQLDRVFDVDDRHQHRIDHVVTNETLLSQRLRLQHQPGYFIDNFHQD